MLDIPCPCCGPRAETEFVYGCALEALAVPHTLAALNIRSNPAGRTQELWQHSSGCRAWLIVERDTRTHEVFQVRLAADEGADR
jgi:sarcosine oxidase subunit delta